MAVLNELENTFSVLLKSIVLFLCMVLFTPFGIAAQGDKDCCPEQLEETASDSDIESMGKTFLDIIYGKTPENGVFYLPYGVHTQTDRKKIANNNLIGVVYHSLSTGTFINSFHDRAWYLVVIRNIFEAHGFGIDYFAGAIYGYKGNLSTVKGIPFRNTFMWKHNVNPIISLDAWYKVTDHIQLQMTFTPLVVLGGFKYNF